MPSKQTTFWSKSGRLKFLRRVNKIEKNVVRGADRFVFKRWQRIRKVRNQIIIWCLLVATILLAVGLQIYFSQTGYRVLTMVSGGTYREGVVGKINSLNPLYATTEAEKSASYLIFSRLFDYDSNGGLKNDLAKSLSVSADGLTYTVNIRNDVLWHDGKKLTAKDIKFTVDLLQNPNVKTSFGNAWRGIKVAQVGDYSIEFTLPAVYAPFRSALTFAILPEHILGRVEPSSLREIDFSTAPVGSGILRYQILRTASAGGENKQVLHLVPNEDYYQARSQLDRFELHAFVNFTDLYNAVRNNEISAASDVTFSEMKKYHDWQFHQSALQNGVFAFFNNDRELIKKTDIRLALRESLDLAKLRSDFAGQNGSWLPLDSPVLANLLDESPAEPKNWLNLNSAAAHLVKAGYNLVDGKWLDANSNQLTLDLVTVKDAKYADLALHLAESWRQFGLAVNLEMVDLTNRNTDFVRGYLQPRNYDVLVYEVALGTDPDQFAYWHSSQKFGNGLNQANYANTLADSLLSTARTSNDIVLRRAKYHKFIEQWQNDVPAIGLVQASYGYATSGNVKTFTARKALAVAEARYNEVSDFLVNYRLVYTTP